MFFLFLKSKRPRRTKVLVRRTSSVGKVMAGLAAASVVPAHGFIFDGKGLATAGDAAAVIRSPFSSWMRTFLGACAWAFMIAAGSLIYSHFVKKWQSNGLPMLPVAALISSASVLQQQQATGGQQASTSQGGLTSGSPQFQRARPPGQTSFMEEYEG